MSWAILGIFAAVYVGMALGRWPLLAVDRTGVAMIGAIALFLIGGVSGEQALAAIDFETIGILFALMIVSAQFAESGFFDWCSHRLSAAARAPSRLLFWVIAVVGALSAFLTNDVVVWALTPVLVQVLIRRGLDPLPFVIALACAANAGSAATVIGNPQNILIARQGGLGFWEFAGLAVVPAVAALGVVFAVVRWLWRDALAGAPSSTVDAGEVVLDRAGLFKSLAAVVAIVVALSLPSLGMPVVLAVAGALLLSRRFSTPRMLALVDWHLLLLFAALFVVNAAISALPETKAMVAAALEAGWNPNDLPVLLAVALAGSNSIGNVPLVTLLLSLAPGFDPPGLVALAVFSTLAGNFLLLGSIATIVAAERARGAGAKLGFLAFARVGIPVTLASLALAFAWLAIVT